MSKASSTIKKAKELRVDALYGKKKHFNAADRKQQWNVRLGLPVVLINIIVGSLLFAIISDEVPDWGKWTGAFLALIAAACSGVQTFFSYPKIIEGHRNVANRYLSVAKESARIIAYFEDNQIDIADLRKQLEELAHTYDQVNLDAQAFTTNDKDFEKARSDFKKDETYLEDELDHKRE